MPSSINRRDLLTRGIPALGAFALAARLTRVGAAEPGAEDLMRKAAGFLKPRQGPDGGWSTERSPGITGVVVTALLRSGQVAQGEPVVSRALGYLEGLIGPEGGLGERAQSNYLTAIALMAFHEANARGRYDGIIKGGQGFLKAQQWDEGEGKGRDDAYFGGAGYGGKSRPDLSNTAFFIEALRDT